MKHWKRISILAFTKRYRSAETLPAFNYFKLEETDNLAYLLKLRSYDGVPLILFNKKLQVLRADIDDDILEEVGLTDAQLKHLNKVRKLLDLKLKALSMVIDTPHSPYISRLSMDIQKLEESMVEIKDSVIQPYHERVAIMEAVHFKHTIDIHKTSILNWLQHIKIYERDKERQKAEDLKRKSAGRSSGRSTVQK